MRAHSITSSIIIGWPAVKKHSWHLQERCQPLVKEFHSLTYSIGVIKPLYGHRHMCVEPIKMQLSSLPLCLYMGGTSESDTTLLIPSSRGLNDCRLNTWK